jgi:hypothetical protein
MRSFLRARRARRLLAWHVLYRTSGAAPKGRSDAMMFAFVLAVFGVAVLGTLNLIAAR